MVLDLWKRPLLRTMMMMMMMMMLRTMMLKTTMMMMMSRRRRKKREKKGKKERKWTRERMRIAEARVGEGSNSHDFVTLLVWVFFLLFSSFPEFFFVWSVSSSHFSPVQNFLLSSHVYYWLSSPLPSLPWVLVGYFLLSRKYLPLPSFSFPGPLSSSSSFVA